ncbi:MAG: 3-hydroxybutyryl-CoA dehydrogenase [Chloroflexia bacterium]|nr:3-hydroxybutyryl-CoA dehydrogenase [Chloroflexia bacterium]
MPSQQDDPPVSEAEIKQENDDGIDSVLVVGAGTMGSGIAQVVAEAGLRVAWYDTSATAVETGLGRIEAAWRRGIEKGRRSEAEVAAFRPRIVPAVDVAVAAATADLVIEAIVEERPVKRSLFGMLSESAPARAILASNTSSLSITEIAGATERPGQVIGLHFFNPVPVLPLVEIVRGLRTSDDTVERSVALCLRLGKTPVVVNDAPGFVSNRILMPMINEAIVTLSDGVATREAIDDVMKLGMAHPIGPLALADLIGLDVCLHILDTLQNDFGDDKYRPAPLLRRMVAAGLLGRKSGEGFYRYDRER